MAKVVFAVLGHEYSGSSEVVAEFDAYWRAADYAECAKASDGRQPGPKNFYHYTVESRLSGCLGSRERLV